MSIVSEQVEAWMRGKELISQLDPLERLIFQMHVTLAGKMSSKQTMERALSAFRNKYYNEFLYRLERPSANEKAFIERLKELDSIKKPSKKDFTTLFEDLCAFKRADWPGGQSGGRDVLADWSPLLRVCPALHVKWYADEVCALQKEHGLVRNTCAVCKKKYTWSIFNGTECPANLHVICNHCTVTESVQVYLNAVKEYVLQVRPSIGHVSESFVKMYEELAEHPQDDYQKQLQDLYQKRTPEGADIVKDKQKAEKRAEELEKELKEWRARAHDLNDMFKDCSISLDHIYKRTSAMENTLHQYKQALDERDDIIRQSNAQLQRLNQLLYARNPPNMQYY